MSRDVELGKDVFDLVANKTLEFHLVNKTLEAFLCLALNMCIKITKIELNILLV